MTRLLDDQIRSALHSWADRAPIAADRLDELDAEPIRGRRRRPMLVAAAAVVVALVAGLAVSQHRDDDVTVAGRPGIEARIAVGRAGGIRSAAADGTSLWVTSANNGVLERIDPHTNDVVRSYDIGPGFEGIAAADGKVWLTGFGDPNRVIALDGASGEIVVDVPVDFDPWGVELAFGSVWVGGGGQLHRIDPEDGAVESYPIGRSAGFATATDTSLWIANPEDDALTEFDPRAGRVVRVVELGEQPRSIAVDAAGDLWVTSFEQDALLHVDAESGEIIGRTVVGQAPISLTVVGDEIWTTTYRQGTVVRVRASTGEVVASHPVGNRPSSIVAAFGSVWLTLNQESAVVRLNPDGALPSAATATFEGRVPVNGDADGEVYVRCSGRGSSTVVLLQDVGHDTGAFPVLEALLAERSKVCIAEHADVEGARLDDALRETLRGAGVDGPVVVLAHGVAGVVGRSLAASSWPQLAGLVLLDTNTVSPMAPDEVRDSRYLASIDSLFEAVDGLSSNVPVLVVAADPAARADPRNGDEATRARFHANQRDLAERLGAEFVVVAGDPWPPTYRPQTLAELLTDFTGRVTAERR
jgi:streptogramin lyase